MLLDGKKKIIKLLLDKNIIQPNEMEIYEFGIECITFKMFNYLVYVSIGVLWKMPIELIFLSIPFISIRKNAGGFHAKTKVRCFFFSVFCEMAALLWIRCRFSVVWIIVILVVSDIVIIKCAPVDTESKRMSLEEKHYYAKQSRKRAAIFTMISLGMLPLAEGRFFLSIVTGISLSAILVILGKLRNI